MSSTTTMLNPKYSFASPRRQLFSLPFTVMNSMLENPSSHIGLMKLYQTCKHFYGKRPILIAENVKIRTGEDRHGNQGPSIKLEVYSDRKNLEFEVYHLQIPIWCTRRIEFFKYSGKLLPSFYRFSVDSVVLEETELAYEDFVTVAAEKKVKWFGASYSEIRHSDKSKASLDQILQHLPNCQYFEHLIDETSTAESLAKMCELKFNNKFELLTLDICDVPSTFDLNLLSEFVAKNCLHAATDVCFPICIHENIEAAYGNLILALEKLDGKWKRQPHRGLRKLFDVIDPSWRNF